MIRASFTVMIAAAIGASAASAADIKVISANGVGEVIANTREKFETDSHHTLTFTVAGPGEIRRRVIAGEAFDVIIAPRDASEEFMKLGKIVPGTQLALARINFGLAVADYGPKPDVSTPEALKRVLLAAKTVIITDPTLGAISSEHFLDVLDKLGIIDQMKNKLVLHQDSDHGRRVAQGQADLGVQAEHEIRCTKGATFLDYPAALQRTIVLIGGISTSASDFAAAKSYLAFITGPEAATSYKAHCLRPPTPIGPTRP